MDTTCSKMSLLAHEYVPLSERFVVYGNMDCAFSELVEVHVQLPPMKYFLCPVALSVAYKDKILAKRK